jgi:hypothetical protein
VLVVVLGGIERLNMQLPGLPNLARTDGRRKAGLLPADNCCVALQDPVRAQALADAQLRADWPQLLQELLQQAHPLHTEILLRCQLCTTTGR